MKKRSNYRPKAKLMNSIQFVTNKHKLLSDADYDYVLTAKLRNHYALEAFKTGNATGVDVETAIFVSNCSYGIWKTTKPPEPTNSCMKDILTKANVAIASLCQRDTLSATQDEYQQLFDLFCLFEDFMDAMTVTQFITALQYSNSQKPTLFVRNLEHVK